MRLGSLILALLCLQLGLTAGKDNAARKARRRAPKITQNAVEIILDPGVIESDDGKKSYIVVLQDQSTTEDSEGDGFSVQNVIEDIKTSCEVSSEIRSTYTSTITGFSIRATDSEVDSLEADSRVKYVYPDSVDYITATSQNVPTPTGISRVLANELSCWDNKSDVVVAVLDTGVDTDHVELRDGITLCKSFIPTETTCEDGNGHGTHVAGTAAGINTGVASGAEIWGVKVLGRSGGGSRSGVIAGIDWVVTKAGDAQHKNKKVVINMSLGGSRGDEKVETCTANCDCGTNAYQESICQAVKKGIPVVVAAGNSDTDAESFFPAAFPEAITVSAVADADGAPGNDVLAWFSNFGESIDIAAPGVGINSATLNGLYKKLSGTSMASPHVAGGALVYISQHMNQLADPSTRVKKLKEALLSAADPQTSTRGFTDNKDNFAEPMLNVKNLESCTPQGKFFNVQVSPKSGEVSYEKGTKKVAMLVKITDENGNIPKKMKKKNFEVTVQKQSTGEVVAATVQKKKLKKGVLTMIVQTAVLENEGLNEFYDIVASAKKRERSGTGKSAIRIYEEQPEQSIFVSNIEYSHNAGNLYIEARLNRQISTNVGLTLKLNGATRGSADAPTNSDGFIRFFLRNPSPGTYTSEFTVSPPEGYAYKPGKNFADPGYEL